MSTFGTRLRLLRVAKAMRADALAASAGLDKQSMSAIENDRRKPRPELQAKIADALEVPVAALQDNAVCVREVARMLGVKQEVAVGDIRSEVAAAVREELRGMRVSTAPSRPSRRGARSKGA